MAYLRWGSPLPSGNSSGSYVIGSATGIENITYSSVSYNKVRKWLKKYDPSGFRQKLGKSLLLEGEELSVLCEMILEERNRGEWREKFDYEPKSYLLHTIKHFLAGKYYSITNKFSEKHNKFKEVYNSEFIREFRKAIKEEYKRKKEEIRKKSFV